MPSKGELVEFKPGLFGIQAPNNFGIFVRSSKRKKGVIITLYTLRGMQELKQSNVYKSTFGRSVQLKNGQLPPEKEMRQRLNQWIKEIAKERGESGSATGGQLTEKRLWQLLIKEGKTEFTIEEIAKVWYGKEEVSKNKVKKIKEVLNPVASPAIGHLYLVDTKRQIWKILTEEEKKAINREIGDLGRIRNKMFHYVEEETEDGETITVRKPLPWHKIRFTEEEEELVKKIQSMMDHFVEYDTWPPIGLGNTRVTEIEDFSIHKFITYLAEDWIDEGRTTVADSFVKFLIRTGYWGENDALLKISKRAINLAPDFEWETPEEIEEYAQRFKEPKETPEVFEGRLDLQQMEAYTIDPPTAKDFDDAVSVIEKEDGYELWVHIADVAHYVEKHSRLDLHAQKRATSVYLPTAVLPMLPKRLSDDLCSLREQVPRLAMSVEIHFDKNGKKVEGSEKVHNSVILVKKNLSYDYVNEAIERGEQPFVTYHKLATLIDQHRRSLHLETPEVKLALGKKMSISIKESSPSTKMIETFMVSANEAIGEIFHRAKVPAIYRDHPLPEKENAVKFNGQMKVIGLPLEIDFPEKLFEEEEEEEEEDGEALLEMLKQQGGGSKGPITFSFGGGASFGDIIKGSIEEEDEEEEVDLGTPLAKGLAQLPFEKQQEVLEPFIKVLDKIANLDEEDIQRLSYLLVLRVFPQAFYSAANIGHFGLGSIRYVHFTSPIRRYPDIIAHRICKQLIAEGRNDGNWHKEEEKPDYVYMAEEIENLADHSTEQSVLASKIEKQIVAAGYSFIAKNESLQNRLGIVSSIFSGGVNVLLPNGIEARIPLRRFTDRPTFVDDFESMCFVGSRSKFDMNTEITPENYKELLKTSSDDKEEPIEIIVELGDKIAVTFTQFNHVEGEIVAAPLKIIRRGEIIRDFELEESQQTQ
ncbi:MAG: RNB domain-containing ribonuclease [Methanobacteriota archaeon]|nr:MAG: RNB domain-containing ribonuclease [Euryarchaeota archaeon]